MLAFLHNETGGTRGRGGGESQRHDSLDGRAANGHKPMYSGKSLGLFFFFFFNRVAGRNPRVEMRHMENFISLVVIVGV